MTSTALFRVDSGARVGAGHLFRCASLAEALHSYGFTSAFLTNRDHGTEADVIREKGLAHFVLEHEAEEQNAGEPTSASPMIAAASRSLSGTERVDWLVIDHYALGADWARYARRFADRILVIDDLAKRPLCGDILVNQNYGASADAYDGLVPDTMERLVGPQYVLLGERYRQARALIRRSDRRSGERNAMVSFGLSDRDDVTSLVLRDIEHQVPSLSKLDVVIGSAHPGSTFIAGFCARHPNATLHVETRSMVELLLDVDLVVGGVGSSTWERMCLGVPILSVASIPHELDLGRVLARDGLIELMVATESAPGDISNRVEELLDDGKHRHTLRAQGMALVDGQGAHRVARSMAEGCA